MSVVLRDFYCRELVSLFFLLLAQAALIGLLIWLGAVPSLLLLWIPLLGTLAVVRMLTQSTAGFRKAFRQLPPLLQERLDRFYVGEHPRYRIYQGELHLLPDCLVCRSRRMLLLIPLEELRRVRTVAYSGRNSMIRDLRLTMQSGKTYRIEFWGSQRERIEQIVNWLSSKNPLLTVERAE